jgi:lipopolysaccharide export system ATP-binding protein
MKKFRIIKFKKSKPVFEVQNVTKSYDGRKILNKINLKVSKGEIFGILGSNGSGKTTLFNLCLGVNPVDSGKIFLNGKEITQLPIHKRCGIGGIGYLNQDRAVFDLSVYDNLYGVAQVSIKGEENQIRIVERLLDQFDLRSLKDQNAHVLSGGQAKRLMLARLLINKPSILLLDEIFAALDPKVVENVQSYILALQNAGVSIILTDHGVKNLLNIIDRGIIISDAGIIAQGTPAELLGSSKAIDAYFGSSFRV